MTRKSGKKIIVTPNLRILMNLVRQGQESIEDPSSSYMPQRYFEKVSGGYQQQCWYCVEFNGHFFEGKPQKIVARWSEIRDGLLPGISILKMIAKTDSGASNYRCKKASQT